MTATATIMHPDACPHPARRQYAWYAFDGILCVVCCQCGTPLRGAIGSAEEWEAEQARPRSWPDRDRDEDAEVSGMRQRRRRDTLLDPDDVPF